MKVGMIVHAYYLKDARVRRYAEALAGRGHDVDVLCLREPNESRSGNHLGVSIFRVNIARARAGRISYVLEYLSAFFGFFFKLNALILRGKRYDIIHVHNMPNFLVFCTLLQRLFGVRVILDVHDLMPEVYQSKYNLDAGHWLPRLLCLEEWISTRFASAVIAANHAFADILVKRGLSPAKVAVVMNAPADLFFLSDKQRDDARRNKPADEFQLIYVGTLAPRYGVEYAIRTIAKLHDSGAIPGLKLSIIPKITNEGSYAEDILAEVERLGLGSRFEMMQPVPHDEMPAVLARADAMIYTPVPDIHMDIALSLKIPEAIAVGCPVVASRLSVNLRYFGEDGLFMFRPGDIEDCAARILDVYQDPAGTAAVVAHARSKLDEISWRKQADGYMNLIGKVLGKDNSYEHSTP